MVNPHPLGRTEHPIYQHHHRHGRVVPLPDTSCGPVARHRSIIGVRGEVKNSAALPPSRLTQPCLGLAVQQGLSCVQKCTERHKELRGHPWDQRTRPGRALGNHLVLSPYLGRGRKLIPALGQAPLNLHHINVLPVLYLFPLHRGETHTLAQFYPLSCPVTKTSLSPFYK